MQEAKKQKNTEAVLSKRLSPESARTAMELYGKKVYPYGFEIHMFTGMIAERAISKKTWFLKVNCSITNAFGVNYDTVCEAKVSGTDSNPKVKYFYVY